MSWAETVKWFRAGRETGVRGGALPTSRTAAGRRFDLRSGVALGLSAANGEVRVRCAEGIVWLTREGDAEDYILRAGEERRIAGRGRIVAQAMNGAARVEVDNG